jgi:hypothetical protein
VHVHMFVFGAKITKTIPHLCEYMFASVVAYALGFNTFGLAFDLVILSHFINRTRKF